MDAPAYSNRELDSLIKGVHEKLDSIEEKVTYTNGKVRKITVALIGVAFFSLGLGSQQLAPLIKILLAL